MSNLMGSMWTAVSGMNTSKSGINTTAHNLSNVNTEGYTRQQSISNDAIYTNSMTSGGMKRVGLGSSVIATRQLRNQFYDMSFREENGRQGFYDAQYTVLSEVEDLFGEMEGVSFQDAINNMWQSMEELSKQPENLTARATFVNDVLNFVERSQDIYKELTDYQADINTTVKETVEKINSLGERINELNRKIVQIEAAGVERANDYRDERNLCLDELANLISIDYKEAIDGTVTVNAEGAYFVSDLSVNKMTFKEVNTKNRVLVPIWQNTNEEVFDTEKFTDLSNYNDSGYLKGLVMARGTEQTHYTDIPKSPVEPQYPMRTDYVNVDDTGKTVFDQEGYNLAVDKYKEDYKVYEEELKKFNADTEAYNLNIGTSTLMTVMAEFDNLVNGIVTSINDVLAPNKDITIIGEDGSLETITVLDEENAPIGMDDDNTMGAELITRRATQRYVEREVTVVSTDENGNTTSKLMKVKEYQKEDPEKQSTLYSLGELEINKDIVDNYSVLPLSQNNDKNSFSYNGVAVKLIEIWDKPFSTIDPNALTIYTFGEYYQAFVSDIGNTGKTLEDMRNNQESILNSIDDQRNSFSGVSSDEELGYLMRYQHAYNAASRYFNIINSMLDNLMGMLG
ncbi:MAG: flagellar hook-associated protein FlgK [Lachnospiraceae bacterium]|nr:flagellar hook-associated protein FlgK [Lachnospiraceae bacterium]